MTDDSDRLGYFIDVLVEARTATKAPVVVDFPRDATLLLLGIWWDQRPLEEIARLKRDRRRLVLLIERRYGAAHVFRNFGLVDAPARQQLLHERSGLLLHALTLVQLQLNAQFRRVTDPEEWGYAFITAAGSQGLAPGATAGPFLLRSEHGYTGSEQSRQDMLKNSQFVDAKVQLFAKYGSVQWVRMGEYPITRQLLEK